MDVMHDAAAFFAAGQTGRIRPSARASAAAWPVAWPRSADLACGRSGIHGGGSPNMKYWYEGGEK